MAGRALAEDRISVTQLLSSLNNSASELHEVQEIIQRSVSLSYRLLRYANSAAFNLPRKIGSIAQAAVIIGQRRLRGMATLLALTGFTVGLFSGLGAMMDQPLDKLVEQLPLADETGFAILSQEGPFGQLLAAAMALVTGDQDNAGLAALQPPPQVYLEAADWAVQALSEGAQGAKRVRRRPA